VGTNRLEAFSDGVIAVAVTLLVLNIDVPGHEAGHSLGHELLAQWPQYAAYAVSFLTIGIIWINHHVMISRLRETDHSILILNLLLLMTIGVLPFATDLLARYLRDGSDQSLAAAVYSGSFLLMALVFSVLNRHVLIAKAHYLRDTVPLEARRKILVRVRLGVIPYAVATGLAFVSPYISLAICAALALYYATPAATRT
jgi:uncharacterized membrane protein